MHIQNILIEHLLVQIIDFNELTIKDQRNKQYSMEYEIVLRWLLLIITRNYNAININKITSQW